MKILVLDLETSISKGSHSGTFRDPSNDFYTLIYGNNFNTIHVDHSVDGFNRTVNDKFNQYIRCTDVIIGHNSPFDLSYIWHNEEFQNFIKRGGLVWDTQVAEYLLSGQRHSFASLAELQLIYLNEKIKETRISRLFSKKHGADEIIQAKDRCPRLFKLFDKYCHDDGQTTLKIAIKQIAKAKEMKMLNIIKVYNAYMLALVSTMVTGIHVDRIKTEKTLKAFRLKSMEFLKQSEEIIKDYWNDEKLPPFNVQSPTHKSALLFGGNIKNKIKEDNGFYKNGKPKTKIVEHIIEVKGFALSQSLTSPSGVAGRYKTGADIIEKILNNTTSPIVMKYCKLQKISMNLEKMCSTYLEPFLNLSIEGILYPYYNNTATATGRLSSSKPNMQNLTSKGEMTKHIKGQLIAPEGYICCALDFSQLEIFVQALLTQDQSLTNDLLSGIDFHILRLSYAEDMSYNDVYKLCKIDKLPEWELKRSKAKTISYQKAYGASPKKLAISTGLDEEVIKKIFEKEDITYPLVREFNEHITRVINDHSELSYSKDIPSYKKGFNKGSKRFIGGIELLPVMKDGNNADFYNEEFRHVGYYQSITGKRYAFEEMANYDRNGRIRKGFSPTQIKNYSIQGTAADIVALATAEIFKYILTLKNDEVRMVNQVHDSIEFYIKKGYESLTITHLKYILEDIPKLFKEQLNLDIPFKFKADVKVGNNFAELKEFNLGEEDNVDTRPSE